MPRSITRQVTVFCRILTAKCGGSVPVPSAWRRRLTVRRGSARRPAAPSSLLDSPSASLHPGPAHAWTRPTYLAASSPAPCLSQEKRDAFADKDLLTSAALA